MTHKFYTRIRRRKHLRQKTLNNLGVILMILIPIYPAFGSYMQEYTGATVRGQYDDSTIISSTDWSTGEETVYEETPQNSEEIGTPIAVTPTIEVPAPTPTETQPQPPVDKKRPLYITYTVKSGDTLSTIAQKYSINLSTVRTANNLKSDTLSIGKKLTIPRINGIQYTVQKGDTLSTIAAKYGVSDVNNIILANDMSGASLSIGKQLLIPNPTKDPTKKVTPPKQPVKVAETKPAKKTEIIKISPTKKVIAAPEVISYGEYSLTLKVKSGCRNFVWWNCTCFVAKYKNVTWRGNAKDWLKNAKKQGIPTGMDPRPGAIIVYSGYGFPPAYGHVGIVMEVDEDDMVIKDMNYRALNEVTTRREKFDNPAIIGYIYVD